MAGSCGERTSSAFPGRGPPSRASACSRARAVTSPIRCGTWGASPRSMPKPGGFCGDGRSPRHGPRSRGSAPRPWSTGASCSSAASTATCTPSRRNDERKAVKSTSRLAAALLALAGVAAAPAAPPRRPIAETDLLKLRWIADPQISPDGRQIAYVLVTVNEKEDRYDTALWTVAASEGAVPRPLTAGPRDSAPRWAPDSHTLAFLRAPEKGAPQVHLLSMSGGEARMLTDLPKGTSAPVWSPDGKTIAFTSGTTPEDLEKKKSGAKPDRKKSDVHLVTEAFYRLNGLGLIDPSSHDHIWTVPAAPAGDGPSEAR